MLYSSRKNQWHHSITTWSLIVLAVGLIINVVISLWEGSDIGFFSANTVFTAITSLLFCAGMVANLSKSFNFFLLFGLLGCFNFLYCIQPIVMWTDEGNLCSGLSAEEQQIGRDCYTAAAGAMSASSVSSFDNLITLVTTCYSNNNILTSASGVCYNIRWGQSTGNAMRAFMLISWLCQFFGTLMSITCAFIEITKFGSVKIKYERVNYLVQKATLIFLRDYYNNAAGTDMYNELDSVLSFISEKEKTE
jgi:hypothetical protein